jgi:hypothetical protein
MALGPGHEIAVRFGDISGLGRVGLQIVGRPFARSARKSFQRPMRSACCPPWLEPRSRDSDAGESNKLQNNAARTARWRRGPAGFLPFPPPIGNPPSIPAPPEGNRVKCTQVRSMIDEGSTLCCPGIDVRHGTGSLSATGAAEDR